MSRSPHRGAAALVALVATAAAAGGAFAQSTRQVALGLAREPFAVVWDAERQRPVLAGRDATAEAFARLWIVGPGFSVEEVLLEGPPDSTLAEARAVAAQARWVAGRTNVEAGPDLRAVRWRNGQWLEPELPPLPDGATRSVANGVSDAGALAGTADGALPFVWNEAAGVRILRPPPGGLPFGRVEWLAPDGASAAGAAVDGEGNERAARWPGLDAPAVRLDDPFGIGSVAFGGSADGRHFAGDVADAGGLRAAVWLDGRLHLPLDGSGLPLRGSARGVGVDRTAWGTARFDGVQRAFLWNPAWGDEARPFADWYVESGGTAEPETWIEATDLAAAGGRYHVALRAASGGYYAEVPEIPTGPWEVGGLRFAPDGALRWDAQTADSVFDALTGDLGALAAGAGSLDGAACLAGDLDVASLDAGALGAAPFPGEGRWYLVRARNPRGDGAWGGDYSGAARPGAPACP